MNIVNHPSTIVNILREICMFDNYIDPVYALTPEGAHSYMWVNGRKRITLFFEEDRMEILKSWGSNIDTEMVYEDLDLSKFNEYWEWMVC